MSEKDPVSIDNVECTRETAAAILCAIDGRQHWIPKSQIDEESEVNGEGDEGTLVISRWLAEQKELD